jgi:FkbM family methyltransferase
MKLIDLGCFNGDSVLHFISYPDIDEIEAYDPNLEYLDIWQAISKHYKQVTFKGVAVYTHNGRIEYTQRPTELPLGSTVMKEKSGWGDGEVREVPCVDILDIVTEDCVLKVDVEGAEYDILERLVEHDRDRFVKRLYVEWHDSKMSSDNTERQEKLMEIFGRRLESWL